MDELTIRIYERAADGEYVDRRDEYGLEAFGGILPSIGDTILDPGVQVGLDRSTPRNRHIWTVVGRVFMPRDNHNYVALVIDERLATDRDLELIA